MIKAILLLSLVAVTFATCGVRDFSVFDAYTSQADCTAGTDLAEGKKCTLTVTDKYMCYGEASKKVTITCEDGCMMEPPCKNTQCMAPAVAPTGFTLDAACTGKLDNTKTCTVTNTDATYVLTKYNTATKVWDTLLPTITCNQGTWSHNFESHQKKKCAAAIATLTHSAGQEVAFGATQTVTPTADYTCSVATTTCGYDGVQGAAKCSKKTCPAALVDPNWKETPACALDKGTAAGSKCTVTAKDNFQFVSTILTKSKNPLTGVSNQVITYKLEGSTYSILCRGAHDNKPTMFEPFPNTNDLMGNSVFGTVKIESTTCDAPVFAFGTVKSGCAANGLAGAACVFEASALYTCTGTTAPCAFNSENGMFSYKLPTCVLKVGCTVPKVDGVSLTGCIAGGKVPTSMTCITAAQTGYTCENTGNSTCGANQLFDKTPTCTKKGDTAVQACYQGARSNGTPMTVQKYRFQRKAQTKIESVVGAPKDYTVALPTHVDATNKVLTDVAYNDNSRISTCMSVAGLTVAQATVLVDSFKTNAVDYTTAMDNAFCFYHFAVMDLDTFNKVPYPRIYINGKLDVPVVSLVGAASITSASFWFIGVLASFLFLGMTR